MVFVSDWSLLISGLSYSMLKNMNALLECVLIRKRIYKIDSLLTKCYNRLGSKFMKMSIVSDLTHSTGINICRFLKKNY
jgi:hypothetical protein